MSDRKQSLTDYVNQAKSPQPTIPAKSVRIITGATTLLAFVFLALWLSARAKTASLQTLLNETTTNLVNAQAETGKYQEQIAALNAKLAEVEKDKEMTSQVAQGLEAEMRSQLESKDVTISKLQGKLTVNILDRILFASGEAILQPDGEAVLQKIAALLANHPELKIHVVGHTDNVPIRPAARTRFASNWELSTARALAAIRFLTERAGVDPRRVGAVGYGEYRPVADNATAEGRARNRRIAITILPDELVGADTVPAAAIPEPASAVPAVK